MTFNIWQGGRLDRRHKHGWENENRNQLAEFIRFEDPDVLFVVETYGAGKLIEEMLNNNQPRNRQFNGIQITREPNQITDRDNLWLFTWLPIQEVYPVISEGRVTSFNFGGARLGLPNGDHIHAFGIWLYHVGETTIPLSRTAMEIALGLDRAHTDEELLATDNTRRMEMALTILNKRIPAYVKDKSPVILGGDLNTQSHIDWSKQFSAAPGHEGLVLEWPVMKVFDDAGFIDTYRYANPDAALYPGRTWSAGHAFTYAPSRIDYILTRGENVRVLASSTRFNRLPEHQNSALDRLYPFYSDHAAVVTSLLIQDEGVVHELNKPFVHDAPLTKVPTWADTLPGSAVSYDEMTASASSFRPGSEPEYAVDGNLQTIWHSRSQPNPPDPHPHTLDIDMGKVRILTGVQYHPRVDGGYYGIVTRYKLQSSEDGEQYRTVASGTWERTPLSKNIELPDVSARYLRFIIESGVGGFSHVALFTPYEKAEGSS